jgi:hypothetical protein
MKRKNDKIYFYYLLRISDNYDEFVNSNYNEINMIKQNYHIASSIDVFIDKLRYEKIRKMIMREICFQTKQILYKLRNIEMIFYSSFQSFVDKSSINN